MSDAKGDWLSRVLHTIFPRRMAEDFDAVSDDAEFLAELLTRYPEADEAGKADMRAFHESDGVERVEDSRDLEAGIWEDTFPIEDDEPGEGEDWKS